MFYFNNEVTDGMIDKDIESITRIYRSNEYIDKNPTLHEQDSKWKVSKIIPMIDGYLSKENKTEINLLDVGGGAGIILSQVADYISTKYQMKVNKHILDLSLGMLDVQKKITLIPHYL